MPGALSQGLIETWILLVVFLRNFQGREEKLVGAISFLTGDLAVKDSHSSQPRLVIFKNNARVLLMSAFPLGRRSHGHHFIWASKTILWSILV